MNSPIDNLAASEVVRSYRRLCVLQLVITRCALFPLIALALLGMIVAPITSIVWIAAFAGFGGVAKFIKSRQWQARKRSIDNDSCPLCAGPVRKVTRNEYRCSTCGSKCTAQRRWNDLREYRKWRSWSRLGASAAPAIKI